jgi:hypothetical protein
LDVVAAAILAFPRHRLGDDVANDQPPRDYFRFEGAFAGYLATVLPSVTVRVGAVLGRREVDILVERGAEAVAVEMKLTVKRHIGIAITQALGKVAALLQAAPHVGGSVILVSAKDATDYELTTPDGMSDRVRIVAPCGVGNPPSAG